MSITEKQGIPHWKETRVYKGHYTGRKYTITIDAPAYGSMNYIFNSVKTSISEIETIIQNISESEESEND